MRMNHNISIYNFSSRFNRINNNNNNTITAGQQR